jgi:hypothetical protein
VAFPAVLARWHQIKLAEKRLDWIETMVLRGIQPCREIAEH